MCITIFCTFLCRPPKLNDYNVKFPSRFYGEHEHKTVTVFLGISELRYRPLLPRAKRRTFHEANQT